MERILDKEFDCIFTTIVTIAWGFFSAVIGIGGSIFYIQMLMNLGYPQFVASSTSMLLVMYASAASATSFAINQELDILNGLWLGIWIVLGVIIGVFGANKLIQKTGRQSIFIFVLSLLLLLGIISTIVFDVTRFIRELK